MYQATLGSFPLAFQIAGAAGGLLVAATAWLLTRCARAGDDDRHSPANWAQAGVFGKHWGPKRSDSEVTLAFAVGVSLLSAVLGSRVPEWLNRALDGAQGAPGLVSIREVVTVRQRRLPARQVAIGPAPTVDATDIRLPLPEGRTDVVGQCMAIRTRPGFLGVAWFETEGVIQPCPGKAR